MDDILADIVEKRRKDIDRRGASFGHAIPKTRVRPPTPFLEAAGAILEVKRASPSKGDIAPDLDAEKQALAYSRAGARAVSVLTEENFFKGSLKDLMDIAGAFAKTNARTAVLRKDFILYPEEIEISYYAGADAVLLIARILTEDVLLTCAEKCARFGMTPFIEVRSKPDALKFNKVKTVCPCATAGINSRDLKNFMIDPLVPIALKKEIDAPTVFESGILSPQCAEFVGAAGFKGILVGEAVSRNALRTESIVNAFANACKTAAENKTQNRSVAFWNNMAEKIHGSGRGENKPLVKICGITNIPDAECSINAGADILGFVFCASSPRSTNGKTVREIKNAVGGKTPFVGVITDTESAEGKEALSLAEEGALDAIQFHGIDPPPVSKCGGGSESARAADKTAFFPAVRISTEEDVKKIEEFAAAGCPRILIDAYDQDAPGGTGKRIAHELVRLAGNIRPLWLAGGITAKNLESVLLYSPELIDVSSGLEKSPGIKDHEKIAEFFEILKSAK